MPAGGHILQNNPEQRSRAGDLLPAQLRVQQPDVVFLFGKEAPKLPRAHERRVLLLGRGKTFFAAGADDETSLPFAQHPKFQPIRAVPPKAVDLRTGRVRSLL